jgi:hypothetical protein
MISFHDVFATVWKVEDKENYALVTLSTSRKDKASGEYKNSNWSFVRFVGDAYKQIDKLGLDERQRIIIRGGCFSREKYQDSDGNDAYPKNVQMTVFQWENPTDDDYHGKKENKNSTPKSSSSKKKMDEPPVTDEDEFPF